VNKQIHEENKMKIRNVFLSAARAFAFVLFFSFNVKAQSAQNVFTEKALGNLVMGIQSDNYGLKRDCIYLAAKYKLSELVNVLVDEFKSEKNPKTRVLIALALYNIGDRNGIESVYRASANDLDLKVRKTCLEAMKNFESENPDYDGMGSVSFNENQ